jgi:hypothetical protein
VWALGHIDFRGSAAAATAAPFSYEWEGFIGPLLDRVESAVLVPTMTAFDMESLLVGLDLLQVQLRIHSQCNGASDFLHCEAIYIYMYMHS